MCLGIPGQVVSIYREHGLLMGKVDFWGVSKQVCLEHVPEIAVNDFAIVHVRFAIAQNDEAEARQVFEFLEAMSELNELGSGRNMRSDKGDEVSGRLPQF